MNAPRARSSRRSQPLAVAIASASSGSRAASSASARRRSRSVGAASSSHVSCESGRRRVQRRTSSGSKSATTSSQNGLGSRGLPSSVAASRTSVRPPRRPRAGRVEEVALALDRVGPREPGCRAPVEAPRARRRRGTATRPRGAAASLLEPEQEDQRRSGACAPGRDRGRRRGRARRRRRAAPRRARARRGRRPPERSPPSARQPSSSSRTRVSDSYARRSARLASPTGGASRPWALRAASPPRSRAGLDGSRRAAQRLERRQRLSVAEPDRLLLDALPRRDAAAAQPPLEEVDVRAGEAGVGRAEEGVELAPAALLPLEAEQREQRLPERRLAEPDAALDRERDPERAEHRLERTRASARPRGRRPRSRRAASRRPRARGSPPRRARASRARRRPRRSGRHRRARGPGRRRRRDCARGARARRGRTRPRGRAAPRSRAAGERREILLRAPERREGGAAGLVGERDRHLRARGERLEQPPLGAGQVLEAVGEHRPPVPGVELRAQALDRAPAEQVAVPEPEPVELGPVGRRAARDRRRVAPGRAAPTRARPSTASSASAKPAKRAERPRPVQRRARRARAARRAPAGRRSRPARVSAAASASSRKTSSNVPIEPASSAPLRCEEVALDPLDVRPVRHDQDGIAVDRLEVSLEQARDLAGLRRPHDESQTHRPIVVAGPDGYRRGRNRKERERRRLAAWRSSTSTATSGTRTSSTRLRVQGRAGRRADRGRADRREPLRGAAGQEALAVPPPPRERGVGDRDPRAPTLRTPEGERNSPRVTSPASPREAGAHQMINRTDEPVRVLMLSTLLSPRWSSTSTAARSPRRARRTDASSGRASAPSSSTGTASRPLLRRDFGRRPRRATWRPPICSASASVTSSSRTPLRASWNVIRTVAPFPSAISAPEMSDTSTVLRATVFLLGDAD